MRGPIGLDFAGRIEPLEKLRRRGAELLLVGRRKADIVPLGAPWRRGLVDSKAQSGSEPRKLVSSAECIQPQPSSIGLPAKS
jgi:hypothetical protein